VREKRKPNQELRLYLPMAVSSLFDPAFAPWLAAELGAHGVSSSLLALEFDGEEIRGELTRLRGALDSLQRVGVRLAMTVTSALDAASVSKLLSLEAFSVIKFMRAGDTATKAEAAWDTAWSKAMAEARTLGKVTVACDLASVADMGVLLRIGAHYVQGDMLCEWLPEWSFDFTEAVL
jgi:EAL domain-containing protein (putative c-di-GMP-specific phosphodiesterase class I)